jgi:serine protease Do
MKNILLLVAISYLYTAQLHAVETQMHPPGMLGVALDEITSDEVSQLGLSGEYGALVLGVKANSPAAKVGLQENDVIVSYNGQRIESARAMQRLVLETPAGRSVELRVIREGKAVLLQPTLGVGQLPTMQASAPRPPKSLGVGVEPIASAVGQYLGLEDGVGVIIRAVKDDSPASEAGLKEKDILVKLDDQNVTSAEELGEQIRNLAGYSATVTIIRGTETQTIDVAF